MAIENSTSESGSQPNSAPEVWQGLNSANVGKAAQRAFAVIAWSYSNQGSEYWGEFAWSLGQAFIDLLDSCREGGDAGAAAYLSRISEGMPADWMPGGDCAV